MKTDMQLKKDVTAELEWDPSINATHVGVAVKNGVVTLTGHLDTFAEKHAIERAVGRVHGVSAITVDAGVVTLSGQFDSWAERAAVFGAACAAPAFPACSMN